MADKEPDNKERDPWKGQDKGGESSPPDLDEVLKKFQNKLNQLFGGKSGGDSGGRQGGTSSGKKSSGSTGMGIGAIVLLIALVWALSGIYIVKPAEEAVVLRFGKYLKTVGPGPHWHPRFIDTKTVIDVEKISNFSYSASMLNKDENIVLVSVAVQYRVGNPRDYLYNVVEPEGSIRQATASALRQVVGHTTLDDVLTTGREQVRVEVSELLSRILVNYRTGIVVTDIAMLPARPPEEVKEAFDDAIKAQEDEQRFINQAQAYAAGVIPIARGQAQRILEESHAYKQRTILEAIGASSRFLALLREYTNAPGVTRDRLYIDALQEVFNNSSTVFIDVPEGSNLLYLPLEQLMQPSTQVEEVDAEEGNVIRPDSASTSRTTTTTHEDARVPAAGYGAQVNRQQGGYGSQRGYATRGGNQ